MAVLVPLALSSHQYALPPDACFPCECPRAPWRDVRVFPRGRCGQCAGSELASTRRSVGRGTGVELKTIPLANLHAVW